VVQRLLKINAAAAAAAAAARAKNEVLAHPFRLCCRQHLMKLSGCKDVLSNVSLALAGLLVQQQQHLQQQRKLQQQQQQQHCTS
jgi:hypothetical protein